MEKYADMEMDDDDALDSAISVGGEKKTPQYPWGLHWSLCEKCLAKIGLTALPEKGDVLHFSAFAEVTNVTTSDGPDGKHIRVELVTTHILRAENESTEMVDA
jgi:hypothetical protein